MLTNGYKNNIVDMQSAKEHSAKYFANMSLYVKFWPSMD